MRTILLYANASFTGEVYPMISSAGKTPQRRLFGNVLQPDEQTGFKGPDGMKFGIDGRLYCTVYGQQNVTVLDAKGQVAGRLKLDGPCPTNIAFSRDGKRLLVTESVQGTGGEPSRALRRPAVTLSKTIRCNRSELKDHQPATDRPDIVPPDHQRRV